MTTPFHPCISSWQTLCPTRSSASTAAWPRHLLGLLVIVVVSFSGCSELNEDTSSPPSLPVESSTSAAFSSGGVTEDLETVGATTTDGSTAPPSLYPAGFPLDLDQAREGWIALFDGHSMFGWESNEPDINWSVQDGTLTADSGPIGLLLTTVPFADFELLVDFQHESDGNSGVFLRSAWIPANVVTDCYELNIADAHPEGFTTGSLVGHQTTEAAPAAAGQWHTFRVICEGPRIQVWLDGAPILDYTDREAHRSQGYLGLQKNAGRIAFRNVLLRPLGGVSLFNGSDLSGWREVAGGTSRFTVEDESIRVVDGPGFLETEQTFGNFILQADSRTNAPQLNSGYFFRTMPGTAEAPSNGYEVQIHNGYLDGDRNRPENAGSGAIFRRQEARRVTADDGDWATTTLVAYLNRMAVWVNGYQVVDWIDERAPHENPRQGRRDEAGHISLQGHDPTTDVHFRRLRVFELAE